MDLVQIPPYVIDSLLQACDSALHHASPGHRVELRRTLDGVTVVELDEHGEHHDGCRVVSGHRSDFDCLIAFLTFMAAFTPEPA